MKRAFTLIEILIVVAIIAILSALLVPQFHAYRRLTHAKACRENINLIKSACVANMMRSNVAETDLDKLSENTGGTSFLRGKPICPIGGNYTITYDSSTQEFSVTCDKDDEVEHNVGGN